MRRNFKNAEEHYKKALAIHEEIGNKLGQAQGLANLGLIAEQRNEVGIASVLLQQAAQLYEEMGVSGEGPEIIRAALQRLEAAQPKE